ncbi:MAG: hypothetical protein U0X20_09390 [Caldilineaceae bacterium]
MAVFREGAETTIFYLGMAPAINPWAIMLLGIGIGVLLLGIAAWLMLVGGVRLPVRLFFRIAGFLVFYLAFKFIGTGIHNLQVAGVVGTTPIPFLPANTGTRYLPDLADPDSTAADAWFCRRHGRAAACPGPPTRCRCCRCLTLQAKIADYPFREAPTVGQVGLRERGSLRACRTAKAPCAGPGLSSTVRRTQSNFSTKHIG